MATKKQPKVTEKKLLERKEAAEVAVKNLDLTVLQEMLEIMKEEHEAGMELQLFRVMRDTGLSREKVLEKMMLEGPISGFPMSLKDADPYDLKSWIDGVSSLNDVLSDIYYKRVGILAGSPFEPEGTGGEEDDEDDELGEE